MCVNISTYYDFSSASIDFIVKSSCFIAARSADRRPFGNDRGLVPAFVKSANGPDSQNQHTALPRAALWCFQRIHCER